MSVYDELLRGVVDLHVHVDLEFSATAFRKVRPEWEWLPRAEAAGMRAVVLKSHLWPTVSAAHYLRELYRGPVAVLPSVTLNPTSGGIEPWAVEAAADQGAGMVFLPTWGAASDRANGGFHHRLAAHFAHFDPARLSTLSLVDESGRLSPATHEVLRICAERGLALGTGHSAWRESLLLCAAAREIGFDRLVFNHPLSVSVQAPRDAIVAAAESGAKVEFCWPTISPGRHPPAEVVALIGEIGADATVLTSDFFGGSNPPPPDLLRLMLGTLHDAGLSARQIATAAARVPARLLGLAG
ncbi:DUF6282 family protein [Phytohabitans kaempferiae]|uniref:DUF6282 family protein n=1 Tax=Phytohabitans kaempferiae TaxID=1620943 RepID=A0ABV6LYI7_9ACTN